MYVILTRFLVFLCFAIVIGGAFFWYTPIIKQNEEMHRQLMNAEKNLNAENENYSRLSEEIVLIQTNPRHVEKIVREGYRYARPGETVFIFEPRRGKFTPDSKN